MSESFHWHEAYMTGLTTPIESDRE